jgi:chromosome partitioning protein
MIIVIGGEKGGTGKTTICTNIASLMARKGSDLLIVDTDKQGSASAWAALRDENSQVKRIPCIQKFGSAIATEIKDLSNRYDDIIIDAGGRDSVELRGAMAVADIIYIPIQASQFDVWTLGAMESLITQVSSFNPSLKAIAIINRASTNPSVSETKETKEIFEDFKNLRLSKCILRDRIVYRKAARSGLAVDEIENHDIKACDEIKSLLNEIREHAEKIAA